MKIELIGLKLAGLDEEINRVFDLNPVCVIKQINQRLCTAILNSIVGLEDALSGEILIDGFSNRQLMEINPLPRVFGYVFDRGIMLSNLSLRENLLLPYKLIRDDSEDDFDREVGLLLESLELRLDLSLRPAYVKDSEIKLLSLVRVLLFKPRILIMDDPYYLLSQSQRERCFRLLCSLRDNHRMLIVSEDRDFLETFGVVPIKI